MEDGSAQRDKVAVGRVQDVHRTPSVGSDKSPSGECRCAQFGRGRILDNKFVTGRRNTGNAIAM
jgi:hypothetical protein